MQMLVAIVLSFRNWNVKFVANVTPALVYGQNKIKRATANTSEVSTLKFDVLTYFYMHLNQSDISPKGNKTD